MLSGIIIYNSASAEKEGGKALQKNILIAVKTAQTGNQIKKILASQGYIGSVVEDAFAALRTLRTQQIALSIIDNDLSGMNGIQLTRVIADEKLGPVVILSNYQVDTGENPPNSLFGVLVKPITQYQLLNTIKLAFLQYESKVSLEKEVESLKDALETRKVVERAKGILMKKHNISEEEAYERIRKTSMEKRTKLKNIAESIVLME